ncbi:MAG: hypothetical protein HS119_11835 [Flavobacteriales bacterium]|nr:hypothetical protein [Flavobacteriales bacterium]
MNLTGQIIFKKSVFNYTSVNKNKIIIRSIEPAKLSVIRKVREEIQNEIQEKMEGEIPHEILYDFKSQF